MKHRRQQWKGVDTAIARSASHMAEASRLLGRLGRADYDRVADGDGVNVAALRALPPARRRNALRAYMVGLNVDEIPEPHRLAERGW